MSLLGALAATALGRIGLMRDLIQRIGQAPSSPTEVDGLRQRLRSLDRDAWRLRAVIAMDQARRVCWDRLERALEPGAIHISFT